MKPLMMPLPETDYQVMNCSHNELFEIVQGLPEETRYYVGNATHRLAETDWITRKLDEEVRSSRGAVVAQEGLLSLQIYLLLTCADTLGHVHVAGSVRQRFRAFFRNLPQEERENLTDDILTWRTDLAELVSLGLTTFPSRQQIMQSLQPLTVNERLEAVIDYLYWRRNHYTHESEYPTLGFHPNLSVMQRQRLNVLNDTLEELDRLQKIESGDDIYFTYIETDDLIATIRWSIVRGLGQIIGRI